MNLFSKKLFIAVLVVVFGAGAAAISVHKSGYSRSLRNLPFEFGRIHTPRIPSRSADIRDFGGVPDGITLNTQAFADAMEHLNARGGGHLIVPEGIWRTGPIEIKSRIDLHVTEGAVIVFDPSRELYDVFRTSFEGLDTRRCTSPLWAEGEHDISITGGGALDGSGDSWRAVKKSKMNSSQWKAKLKTGGVLSEDGKTWYPDEGYMIAEATADMNVPDEALPDSLIKSFLRPVMVSLRDCERVLVKDCLFQNSPAWCIHPLLCRDLVVDGITVRNPEYSQNGDGIDIESCTRTLLKDSYFDCGDDGICIKSGKDEDGRRRGVPCSKLVVENCTVCHGHGGFVVGSEMSGGVNDMMVRDCRFLGTDVGLRFKSKRGRGGIVEGIWIEDIRMTDIVTDGILFDLHYGGKSAVEAAEAAAKTGDGVVAKDAGNSSSEGMGLGKSDANADIAKECNGAANGSNGATLVADETTPAFRDIHISNVTCAGAGRAMYFNGLPEMPVRGIDIRNSVFSARKGAEIYWAEDVRLSGVDIRPAEGDALKTDYVKNIHCTEN